MTTLEGWRLTSLILFVIGTIGLYVFTWHIDKEKNSIIKSQDIRIKELRQIQVGGRGGDLALGPGVYEGGNFKAGDGGSVVNK